MNALILAVAALTSCVTPASHAEVLLATDFTGRTVSGNTASDITWTVNGVSPPGNLTAVDVNATGNLAGLFDTAASAGHFAPNLNTDNEGPWSATLTLHLTAPSISLENVVLDYQHFNNTGAFQGVGRVVNWTVTVTGSLSGQLGRVKVNGTSSISGTETIVFGTPLELTNAESYDVAILAEGSGPGNNTGLDALTLNGSVAGVTGSITWSGLGASNITENSAWVYATVNTNLDELVLVWDTSDKGDSNTADWTYSRSLGIAYAGVVTGQATNLLADTSYTWRFYGTNSFPTNGWSASATFSSDLPAAQKATVTDAGSHLDIGEYVRTTDRDGDPDANEDKERDADGDNIYGTDGYVFYGVLEDETDFGYKYNLQPNTRRSIPSYLTSVGDGFNTVQAPPNSTVIDSPDLSGPHDVENDRSAVGLKYGYGSEAVLVTLTIGSGFPADGVRVGIFTDNQNYSDKSPMEYYRIQQTTGGGTTPPSLQITAVGDDVPGDQLGNDFYFFDIKNAAEGDVFTVYGLCPKNYGPYIGGLTFDRIAHTSRGTVLTVR